MMDWWKQMEIYREKGEEEGEEMRDEKQEYLFILPVFSDQVVS